MALTNWNDILNKPRGIDEVPEIALTVEQLSASVLSISEDLGEVAGDVQEIALEVSQLSASTLPYSATQSIKEKIDEITQNEITTTTSSPIEITTFNVEIPLTITDDCYVGVVAVGEGTAVNIMYNGMSLCNAVSGGTINYVRNALFVRKGTLISVMANQAGGYYRIWNYNDN